MTSAQPGSTIIEIKSELFQYICKSSGRSRHFKNTKKQPQVHAAMLLQGLYETGKSWRMATGPGTSGNLLNSAKKI